MRFVLLDRVVRLDAAERLVAESTFDPSEELFRDHFPGRPMVPGTLLTEAIAQAGGWLTVLGSGFAVWPILALVEQAKFRRPVRPGTTLTVEVWRDATTPAPRPGATLRVSGVARIGTVDAARARCVYQLFEPSALGLRGPAYAEWLSETYSRLGASCAGCPPAPELPG